MLRDGIIRPSSSPWSFPVILVKKRDGKYRFCVYYRKLNEVTVKDVYPIPRIDEVLDTLQGSKYFSAIDLKSGYWQVEVEEKDKEKTAFTTAHGLYEFNVMPFGLCNAPATFERNMENMLGNLRWQICLCYLDDVIIYSSDFSTHLKRIEAVLKCFREANLKLNNKKCQFAFEELEILGHITNQHGIKPATSFLLLLNTKLSAPDIPHGSDTAAPSKEACLIPVIQSLPFTIPTCTNDVLKIDDFERIVTIGRGGFGSVFLAQHKDSRDFYALKAMKKRPDFKTEREVLQIVKGFPFLMGLVTSFETPDEDILVMDLVKGFNFLHYMNQWKKISEEKARFYTTETALALHYLHTHNIIHRDVKLENILLNSDGHIKLFDYGLCKLNMRPGQKTNRFCGTLTYMAPEIIQKKPYDFGVDWWALGATLYEMLVGRSAFVPPNEVENNQQYIVAAIQHKPIYMPHDLSYPAISVLRAFLNRDPETRLGCHPEYGWEDVKNHPFYQPLDFEAVLSRSVLPPYMPKGNTVPE
ncbi:PRKCI [Cordylochernes scorpioides]|uniref:PRKCI n=1 Tax=Cordylochernes scorpioides TaxID=51811 RepID=A0ABY6LSH1_9ARAC|nr:PRKCI [Cordylochernes scorpioides]